MKQYLKYFTIAILLFLLSPLKSQIINFASSNAFGEVIDDSTEKEIAFTHIFNESQRRGYITDEEGKFNIPAAQGDTLIISALGYHPQVVFLRASSISQEIVIKLRPQVYSIGEVSVNAFRNYEDFKEQFLALDLSETDKVKLRNNLITMARKEAVKAEYERIVKLRLETPGIRLISVPLTSSQDKEMDLYAELLKKEKRQRIIQEKFNREIIQKITYLTEEEITEFIGFCNFSEKYLYEATEYDILVKLEEKFKDYKLWKESGSFRIDDEITLERSIG